MTKRIVSGIFILTALGALGVILAGALTSGEQLIVRFLTAVIVAALGLYVISDLRLQADDDAAAASARAPAPDWLASTSPPNSTAAFMATVTGKGESTEPNSRRLIRPTRSSRMTWRKTSSIEPHAPRCGNGIVVDIRTHSCFGGRRGCRIP